MHGSLRTSPRKLSVLRVICASFCFFLLGATVVSADPISLSLWSAPGFTESGNCCQTTTMDYVFTTTVPFQRGRIRASSQIPFSAGNSQDVALYNAGGTELTETWVSPSDPASGGYTWASVPELTLDPGTYAVADYVNGNTMFWSYEWPVTAPGVTWVNEYYSSADPNLGVFDVGPDNNNGVDPNGDQSNIFFGPNVAAETPEPASAAAAWHRAHGPWQVWCATISAKGSHNRRRQICLPQNERGQECPRSRTWVLEIHLNSQFRAPSFRAIVKTATPRGMAVSVSFAQGVLLVLVLHSPQGNHMQFDRRQPCPRHLQPLGRCEGKVDDPVLLNQVASVSDLNHHRALILGVDHPNDGTEGEGGVASRHCIHVVALSARGPAAVEDPPVPGGDSMQNIGPSFFFGLHLQLLRSRLLRNNYWDRHLHWSVRGKGCWWSQKTHICLHGRGRKTYDPSDQSNRRNPGQHAYADGNSQAHVAKFSSYHHPTILLNRQHLLAV